MTTSTSSESDSTMTRGPTRTVPTISIHVNVRLGSCTELLTTATGTHLSHSHTCSQHGSTAGVANLVTEHGQHNPIKDVKQLFQANDIYYMQREQLAADASVQQAEAKVHTVTCSLLHQS